MRKIENRCVGCAVPAYPCRGSSCPLLNCEVPYCDECGNEIEDGYIYEKGNEEFCGNCFEKLFGEGENE